MTLIKIVLLLGLLIVTRIYLRSARSTLRDRLVLLPIALSLVAAVIYPDYTSAIAHFIGVRRGADLAFYLGFLLIFFLVGALRLQVRDNEHKLTALIREVAILTARAPHLTTESQAGSHESQPGAEPEL